MTELGRRETDALYGPLATGGGRLLERLDDHTLRAFHAHLLAAAELIDRHRARLLDAPVAAPEDR